MVERGPEQCGTCHAQTYIGWQVSKHGSKGLTCVSCHDMHAAGGPMKTDVSYMCADCHKNSESNFAHRAHVPVGLACAECHLGERDTNIAVAPHQMQDHSFAVKVATCNECHTSRAQTMVMSPQPTPAVDALTSTLTAQAAHTPQPVSPVGFSLVAIVLGFGVGIVVAPWAERWYRRNGKTWLNR